MRSILPLKLAVLMMINISGFFAGPERTFTFTYDLPTHSTLLRTHANIPSDFFLETNAWFCHMCCFWVAD